MTTTQVFQYEGIEYQVPCHLLPDTGQAKGDDTSFDGPETDPGDNAALLLSPAQSTPLIHSLQAFQHALQGGHAPDVALCETIRDSLVSELTQRIDQLQYLSQLRVRDPFTYSHTLHVSALSVALGMKVGLNQHEVQAIGLASILHDLGKLFIPKPIMFKTSRLTEKEFEVMKLHPGIGYRIIRDQLKLSDAIARPALEHQEMWGGGGYPQNLKGNEIHPYSQIVKIADVYDALTSRRPYKDAIPSAKALAIMLSEGEKSFNPEYMEAFLTLANHEALVTAGS
jgi:HD-GYP domain-containing protein (c-di-GMP phosphodiesterase class II)